MRTGRPKTELVLSDEERSQRLSFARRRSLPAVVSNQGDFEKLSITPKCDSYSTFI